MMKVSRCVLSILLWIVMPVVAASAADFEFKGRIDAQDPTSRLLAYYVDEFAPEDLLLIIDEQPDDTGRFRDLYMDLTGVLIGGVRVDKLVFRMNDVQFNLPSEWLPGTSNAKARCRFTRAACSGRTTSTKNWLPKPSERTTTGTIFP